MKLVIASHNTHKIREFRTMLREHPDLDLFSLLDFPDYVPPQETGETFEENARAKALDAAQRLNMWALGDDSGLVVPALHGEPGVYSARYAGINASDRDNRVKLLAKMQQVPEPQRQAYFECALALASPHGIEKEAKGLCEGFILLSERGGRGFGYDPLFVKHGYGKTFAELDEELKNRISHRKKAVDKLYSFFCCGGKL